MTAKASSHESLVKRLKYLAIDSSTKALSLALIEDEAVVAQQTLLAEQQHGILLVPAVAQLMEQLQWKTSDLDGLITGIGPGSYTGLRVGVTFAKTWANSKNVPLYSVSSLALMAAAALQAEVDTIVPVMDARRLSAYTAIYRKQAGKLEAVVADAHVDWREWLKEVADQLGERVILVGAGIDAFLEAFLEEFPDKKVRKLDDWSTWPHASKALFCPWDFVSEATLLAPNYVHATLAEREWAQKNNTTIASEGDHEEFIEHFT